MIEPTKVGEDCHLYLPRSSGKGIIDRLLAKTTGKNLLRVRAKVVLLPSRYEEDGWDLFELLDVQFGTDDANGWQPWFVDAKREADAEAEAKGQQAAHEASKQREMEQAKAREKERAQRTRTWKDTTGNFSVVAEYSGTGNGTVSLRKQDGKVVRVPIERLYDEDRKWIESKRNAASTSSAAKK